MQFSRGSPPTQEVWIKEREDKNAVEVVRVGRMETLNTEVCKSNVHENDMKCLFKFKFPGIPKSVKSGFNRSEVEVLDSRIYIFKEVF